MKQKFNFIFILLFLSLLLVPLASAWMSPTHRHMNSQAIQIAPNSVVGKVVSEYPSEFNCGNYLADASVFYYFSEGFTSIGKEYRSTHSSTFCLRAVALAQRSGDKGKLAFAYGICAHQIQDSIAHNYFVPSVIEKSKLPNGLVHVLAEEKVDDKMRKIDNQKLQVNNELLTVCPQYKDFFVEVAEGSSELQNVDVGRLYDAFIEQVGGSTKYSLGFQSFLAVPISIHMMLLLIFVLMALVFVFIARIKKKNIFNKIAMILIGIIAIIIIVTYILYFTGNFWKVFQTLSYPLSQPLPTAGWEGYIQDAIDSTVKFFNSGTSYMNTIPDPSGAITLAKASKSGAGFRTIFGILSVSLIILFVWLNFKKKKKI